MQIEFHDKIYIFWKLGLFFIKSNKVQSVLWLLDARYTTSKGYCQSIPNNNVTKTMLFHGLYILNSLTEPWWILKLNKISIGRSSEAMSPWWRPWTWPSHTVIGIWKVQEWPGLNSLLNLNHIKFHLPRDWQGYNGDVCVCVSADNENRLMCFLCVCAAPRLINQVGFVCVWILILP